MKGQNVWSVNHLDDSVGRLVAEGSVIFIMCWQLWKRTDAVNF